jgi:hypothetical protein
LSPSSSLRSAFRLALLFCLGLWGGSVLAVADDPVAVGRRIYMEGILPSGAPLTGLRLGAVRVSGREAACVQCHRRSGMGAVEGDVLVAPITGRYLFSPPDKSQLATMDPRRSKSFNMTHAPYDDATLARAIRTGINVGGRTMNEMMPRYTLDAASLKALTAYLRQLTVDWSPGAGDQVIRLATIVTPGVDPAIRQVVLDMLRTAVLQKNANTVVGGQHGGRRHMVSAAELVLGTERKWALDVWELQGAPDTWRAQLEAFYRQAPVFAVLSGLANGTWEPVHDFCEAQQLPCWFPVVDLPPVKADDFYSVYFSRGVLLDADVLARHLVRSGQNPGRVVQVHRDDAVGRAAAAELTHALAGSGVQVDTRAWAVGDADSLAKTLADVGSSDTLMLWLRREDLGLLAGLTPPAPVVYFSGQLLAGERGVPVAWKQQARLVYPYELPQKRALSLAYFHQWLRIKRLPLVDEPLQSKVFFATNFLTDTLVEMLENLHRDYLLERAENMISRREGAKAENEAQSRQILRRAARAVMAAQRGDAEPGQALAEEPEMIGMRQSTTVFPRMGLAPGQRFASKGAYIVKFADTHSDTIVAETDWIVP